MFIFVHFLYRYDNLHRACRFNKLLLFCLCNPPRAKQVIITVENVQIYEHSRT